MDELEYYSLIQVEKNKKEIKNSKFCLNVELSELAKELDILEFGEKPAKETKEG